MTTNRAPVIPVSSLLALQETLATARGHLAAKEPQSAVELLQAALDALAESLVEPASLPAMEIASAEPCV